MLVEVKRDTDVRAHGKEGVWSGWVELGGREKLWVELRGIDLGRSQRRSPVPGIAMERNVRLRAQCTFALGGMDPTDTPKPWRGSHT